MKINKNLTVSEVQKTFNGAFPNLKIEFYTKEHQANEGSPLKATIDSSLFLEEVQPNLSSGTIDLDASKTVAQFEQEMEEQFGLHIQVFRKSTDLWLQTTATDQWTLKIQNEKGE